MHTQECLSPRKRVLLHKFALWQLAVGSRQHQFNAREYGLVLANELLADEPLRVVLLVCWPAVS